MMPPSSILYLKNLPRSVHPSLRARGLARLGRTPSAFFVSAQRREEVFWKRTSGMCIIGDDQIDVIYKARSYDESIEGIEFN
jgi:hypothetical protein